MSIQLFIPTFRTEECLKEVRECLEKGWTGLGYKTVDFEEEWKRYTGFDHAHFLNSNTAGLEMSVEILKRENEWADGDEVITTPITFVSSNHAILHNNLKPVFADVDTSLCLDPADVAKKITKKTRAIMFVGMGGNIGKYFDIVELAKKYKLVLILDAAHMAGTRFDGEIVGKEADVVVYSFQAVKNLPTADSGMICFKDKKNDEIVRKLSWLGINKDTYARTTSQGAYKWMYDVEYTGWKYNGNAVTAGIALVQLKYLDQDNAYRRQICEWYDIGFRNNKKIELITHTEGVESARHLYQIVVEKRDEMMLYLNKLDIFPGVHYRDNTLYQMYKYAHGTCPVAHNYSDKLLTLPLHLRLNYADVQTVIEAVNEFTRLH